jgi:hypothetical protein
MRTRDMLGRVFTAPSELYGYSGGTRFEEARHLTMLDGRIPFMVVEVTKLPQRRTRILQVLSGGTMYWIVFNRSDDFKELRHAWDRAQ